MSKLTIGSLVDLTCKPVDHLVPKLLGLSGDNKLIEKSTPQGSNNVARGKLFKNNRNIGSPFVANNLQLCNDLHDLAQTHQILRLALERINVGPNISLSVFFRDINNDNNVANGAILPSTCFSLSVNYSALDSNYTSTNSNLTWTTIYSGEITSTHSPFTETRTETVPCNGSLGANSGRVYSTNQFALHGTIKLIWSGLKSGSFQVSF